MQARNRTSITWTGTNADYSEDLNMIELSEFRKTLFCMRI